MNDWVCCTQDEQLPSLPSLQQPLVPQPNTQPSTTLAVARPTVLPIKMIQGSKEEREKKGPPCFRSNNRPLLAELTIPMERAFLDRLCAAVEDPYPTLGGSPYVSLTFSLHYGDGGHETVLLRPNCGQRPPELIGVLTHRNTKTDYVHSIAVPTFTVCIYQKRVNAMIVIGGDGSIIRTAFELPGTMGLIQII